jgi:hypothetical protein
MPVFLRRKLYNRVTVNDTGNAMPRKPTAEFLPAEVLAQLQQSPVELAAALAWADESDSCGIHMRGWYGDFTKYRDAFPRLYDAAGDLRDDWRVHVVVARVEYERKDGPEIRVAMKAFFDSYPKAETQA